MRNLASKIGQAKIATALLESQPCVIEAEQMQDRGMQVIDVQGILNRLVTDIVSGSAGHTALHAAARHTDNLALALMIAVVIALGVGRAAKLAAQDHKACPSACRAPTGRKAWSRRAW
jgi:hypothetical protein